MSALKDVHESQTILSSASKSTILFPLMTWQWLGNRNNKAVLDFISM